MDFGSAFWLVFHRIFKWRPIVMGCCDCEGSYYLSKDKIVRYLENSNGDVEPVIACPYCDLEHLVVFIRLDSDVVSIKWEVLTENEFE